jgi:hypothetical protein
MSSGVIRTLGFWSAVILAGLALAVTPVLAQAGMQPLSSGVGLDNRQPHPEYPLKLVFAVQSGAFLADVNVKILDETGKEVAKMHSPGPWLFVDLPEGTYKVVGLRKDGKAAAAHFTVSKGQTVVTLIWKATKG